MGIAWLLALLGLVATAAAWHVHKTLRLQLDALLQAQRQQAAPAPAASPVDPLADRAAAFKSVLVAWDDVPGVLQDLLDSAQQRGLRVSRGEYRATGDDSGLFVRQRMVMPVTGDGAAVQSFVLEALRAQPALAVESAQFKRESAASAAVEARIHWVLFVRPAAAGATRP